MKFLCPNCKAKYQIADEKVGGRTLKMDCRRCGHSILLRGDQPSYEEPEAPAASPRTPSSTRNPVVQQPAAPGARRPGATGRGGSHVGPAPARPAASSSRSLSADFRRSVTGSAPIAPDPRTTPLDQWHVAINDVPVGPMRREEIARKISTGAVNGESLAWREGFDDWRPLRDIPELSQLLRRTEPQRQSAPPRPPTGRIQTQGRPPAPGAPHPARPGPARPAATASRPDQRAAARSNVVPIGGRLGASAAPALDDDESLEDIDAEPTRVASHADLDLAAAEAEHARRESRDRISSPAQSPAVGPAKRTDTGKHAPVAMLPDPFPSPMGPAAVAPAEPVARRDDARRGLPIGAWIGIMGAVAFGVTMAVIIAPRLLGPAPVAPAAIATTLPSPTGPVATAPVAPAPTPEAATPEAAPEAPPVEAAATTPERTTHGTTSRRSGATAGGSTTATAAAETPPTPHRSTASDAVFDRFRDDGETEAAPIETRPPPTTHHAAGSSGGSAAESDDEGEGLEPAQIRSVVLREQRGLQNCYEVAIRGLREVPTVRMDVDVSIGASGSVTSATARGVGVGNLSECIERSVRRWRFPAASGSSRTTFPLVFQGR
jgi:predicted Zn finger-like uncharacterized protein